MFKENFDKHVCVGDTIQCETEGFGFVARVEYDYDTKPADFDCYSEEQIEAWRNDKWFYCGIVLSAYRNGYIIDTHCASLWGIDANLDGDNWYLRAVANELLSEALETAKASREAMRKAIA